MYCNYTKSLISSVVPKPTVLRWNALSIAIDHLSQGIQFYLRTIIIIEFNINILFILTQKNKCFNI